MVPELLVMCSSEGSGSLQLDINMGQYTPRCEHGVSTHLDVIMGQYTPRCDHEVSTHLHVTMGSVHTYM